MEAEKLIKGRNPEQVAQRKQLMLKLLADAEYTQENEGFEGIVNAIFNVVEDPDDAWRLIHIAEVMELLFKLEE